LRAATSTRFWLAATGLVSTALLFAAAARAQQVPEGEQIMNASCGVCHDARPIQTAAKDEAAWMATVDDMIERGAVLRPEDKPALITYLVRFHGPMPDGRGKDIVLNTCSLCHDLTRIKRSRHTVEEWEDTLVAMLNEGAPLSDEEFPVVLTYLARNFGAE
jgi:cytochrome c5